MRRVLAPSIRRWSYYVVLSVGALVVHQAFTISIVGSAAAGVLRRNSEAYVLMFVPAYWDLFARGAEPSGRSGNVEVGPSWAGQVSWFAVIALVSTALPLVMLSGNDIGLSQAVITLQEGFLGLFVVSAYLGITRAILPPTHHRIDGRAVISVAPLVVYYAIIAVVAILAHLDRLPGVLPAGIEEWLTVNVEAYAAMLLIPLYFDVVADARTKAARIVWYASLLLIPLAANAGVLDGILPASLVDWITRANEAFIAAAVVSFYFDLWRGPVLGRGSTEDALDQAV